MIIIIIAIAVTVMLFFDFLFWIDTATSVTTIHGFVASECFDKIILWRVHGNIFFDDVCCGCLVAFLVIMFVFIESG